MSDPKYNKYKGTVRFDDDNIVDIDLQPDTENITVLLNGNEVTGGGGDLPEVDSGDNGKVLTVVEGEWAAATQTAELPAVSGSDNGDVLTVVEGAWAKADPPTELPAVTGADNGDVLTVVEGAWAKAALPGRVLYGLAESSGDPPSDAPAAPAGFVWDIYSSYIFINLQTSNPVTLQEMTAFDLDNVELREDVHEYMAPESARTRAVPLSSRRYNTFDPEDPAEYQEIVNTMTFVTGEGQHLTVGWSLQLKANIE